MDREYLTAAEAAEMARVSRRTIYRWDADGKLARRKIGARVLYRRDELERILDGTADEASALDGLDPAELGSMTWAQARQLAAARGVSLDALAAWQDRAGR